MTIEQKTNLMLLEDGNGSYFDTKLKTITNDYPNIYTICGGFNLDYEVLKVRLKIKNINILKFVNNIEEYMKNCDLAISGDWIYII